MTYQVSLLSESLTWCPPIFSMILAVPATQASFLFLNCPELVCAFALTLVPYSFAQLPPPPSDFSTNATSSEKLSLTAHLKEPFPQLDPVPIITARSFPCSMQHCLPVFVVCVSALCPALGCKLWGGLPVCFTTVISLQAQCLTRRSCWHIFVAQVQE